MKDMQIGVYDNFVTTIKSKATRMVYHNNLNLFMQFLGIIIKIRTSMVAMILP